MTISENKKFEIPFSSNSVRLTVKQCILAAALCIVTITSVPFGWKKFEKFTLVEDYRLLYQQSNDYWQFQRACELACEKYETVILGDSVVWGHYVPKNKTLPHYLNELTDSEKYANLGVDGMHPAALDGLIRYYGGDIKNKNVILHLNLLWMSSPMVDLQTDKEFHFNHPKLVSQFFPEIPCYKASFSARLGIVSERCIDFASWTTHLNITYFQNLNMPAWTIDNPYKNPISAIKPLAAGGSLEDSVQESQITKPESQDPNHKSGTGGEFQWVESKTSLQWKFFRNSVKLLRNRGNKVFVLIGPFNESALGAGRENYQKLKSDIELWLRQNNIACFAPAALPAELYNDASHPNAEGYKILAGELVKKLKSE